MEQRKDTPNYEYAYPPLMAMYEKIVASPEVFMETLTKFHVCPENKLEIPHIGGKELDLHRLFVEVTSRGGITKVLRDKRLGEVALVFSFPSYLLREYYFSLLFHYERVYYFKELYWTPSPDDVLHQVFHPHHHARYVISSPEIEAAMPQAQPQSQSKEKPVTEEPTTLVSGVIDAKFASGSVKIGSEDTQGVLHQVPINQDLPNKNIAMGKSASTIGVVRTKKCEIKKRDPAYPKRNSSSYNFFMAEQHPRLKALYPGKDRDIIRKIAELWKNLKVPEKMIYQEKALQDKQRYRLEVQEYHERSLRTGEIFSIPLPTQFPLEHNVHLIDQESEDGNDSSSSEQVLVNEHRLPDEEVGKVHII